MPISAPMPNSPPSANWVDALTMTMALSTRLRKASAVSASSVMMDSVCWEPWRAMWATAASTPSTTATEMMASRYSVFQSSSVAGTTLSSTAQVAASPRTSQPAAIRSSMMGGRQVPAMRLSTSRVSVVPQIPVRRILALRTTLRAMSASAAAST